MIGLPDCMRENRLDTPIPQHVDLDAQLVDWPITAGGLAKTTMSGVTGQIDPHSAPLAS